MLSIPIEFPYTTPTNYTLSDSNKIGIDNGKAVLLLQQDNIDYIEDFADDTGHTYDSDLAKFIGGLVQHEDQTPADSTFGATYTNDINGSFGDGVLTGTSVGGASVSGGYLDLTYNDVRYIDYSAVSNADSPQVGCIEFSVTPKYSGTPPSNTAFITICKAHFDRINRITIYHNYSDGALVVSIVDKNNSFIFSATSTTWSPVADTKYLMSLNYDLTLGATRLFIDGVQFGPTQTQTGERDSNIGLLRIGSSYGGTTNSNFEIDNVVIYDTVQHTSNYTPSSDDIPEYKYLENSVIIPEMEHVGAGSINLFNSLTSIYTGLPRVLIEVGRSGNKIYWNGSAWVISDETYSQATDPVTFNANFPTLAGDGEKYVQFTIVFPNSNTISSFSNLVANMNVDIGYPTDNPTIETNTSFRADGLISFTETSVKTGLDEIKHILKKDNNYYWNNVGTWEVSNETYPQANTATEIETYKDTFLTEGDGKNVKVKSFLHSNDGTTKPDLDKTSIEYDFSGDPPTLRTITFSGNARDLTQAIITEDELLNYKLQVRCNWIQGSKVITASRFYEETLSAAGYFEIPMIFEDGYLPTNLEIRLIDKVYKTNFIDQDYITFGDLTVLWQNKTEIDYLGG